MKPQTAEPARYDPAEATHGLGFVDNTCAATAALRLAFRHSSVVTKDRPLVDLYSHDPTDSVHSRVPAESPPQANERGFTAINQPHRDAEAQTREKACDFDSQGMEFVNSHHVVVATEYPQSATSHSKIVSGRQSQTASPITEETDYTLADSKPHGAPIAAKSRPMDLGPDFILRWENTLESNKTTVQWCCFPHTSQLFQQSSPVSTNSLSPFERGEVIGK